MAPLRSDPPARPRAPEFWTAIAIGNLLGLAILLLTVGCTLVRPPAPDRLKQPCRVCVLHASIHLALLLPDASGAYTQWGFGDRWCMTTNGAWTYAWNGALVVVGAIGPVTPAVLERIPREGRTPQELEQETGMSAISFLVERAAVDRLSESLEAQYRTGAPEERYRVMHDAEHGYSVWWYNCQSAVVDWVRQLDCEVSALRVTPRWLYWKVEP